jgi:DNA repair protein RadC
MHDYARLRLGTEKREHFEVAYFNSQHFLIETVRMFSGTINQSPVFPREIVRKGLELNAAAVVLMHNHPSGIAEPSAADRAITDLVVDACKLLDIRVLDHIIVGNRATYSFADKGLI